MTWDRLDRRMLLVHPVTEVVRFAPVLLGVVLAGGSTGLGGWSLLGVAAPVVLGVVRYLTTTYRITADRVELRRGLLHRHSLSAPTDRVRTVDLTASPVHRVLGLATVVIGTGSGAGEDERLELDALSREQAAALRQRLLRAGTTDGPADTTTPTAASEPEPEPESEVVLARFSPRWLWYAPFSGTVLVALGALTGVLVELADTVQVRLRALDVPALGGLVLLGVVAAVLALTVVVGVVGYLLVNGGFVLARHGTAWQVRRGLLTRRETSIDTARLAGVRLAEPALLRAVGGRRLTAVVTGLSGAADSSDVLLPPAPAATARRAMAGVLGDPAPVTGPLSPHGRAAATRRYVRVALGVSPVIAALVAVVLLGASPWLLSGAAGALLLAVLLAADRVRGLGHAHLAGHVVMRSGSLRRSRDVLADAHVIGWNLRDTWFQRRAGLLTLAATTAGGGGRVQVPDVPVPAALALAASATPGLVEPFLQPPPAPALPEPSRRRAVPRGAAMSEEPHDRAGRRDVPDGTYAPRRDGDPDPGEVVWAWVPYEDDPVQGKDRPVLVIGTGTAPDGTATVRCLVLTSQDHDRDAAQEAAAGRHWMDVGSGAWDARGRPSEVRLDRLVVLRTDAVRREGAALDAATYARVLAAHATFAR